MNVEAATMNVPFGQAREAYKHYRTAVKAAKATRDDVMLYRGLRAMLRGQHVIDINLAVGHGGRDAHGRPKLAIARADWLTVKAVGSSSGFKFCLNQWGRRAKGEVTVPLSSFPAAQTPEPWHVNCDAQVPLVPPQHRPDDALGKYHLLFEAEWQKVPPVDPLLLKRVDGPFFVVLAAWDLTPLEQAVLRQRM